ncbi:MAG: M15 family metallopeptidase [Oscillospiraceae bacterium]|nr:M15 family metallopeptidase [Oscillospiraceae bacterium]
MRKSRRRNERTRKKKNKRKVVILRLFVISIITIGILLTRSNSREAYGENASEALLGNEDIYDGLSANDDEDIESEKQQDIASSQIKQENMVSGRQRDAAVVQTSNTNTQVVTGANQRNSNAASEAGNIGQADDWRIRLVNIDNPLPDNFSPSLANIDQYRRFDSRAIGQLNDMVATMRRDGVTNIWVQSAYRSIAEQRTLFENRVNRYTSQGHSRAEAEQMTSRWIMPPGRSEHNLGLAVDFNTITHAFVQTAAYEWLVANAHDFGFIYRYQAHTEHITGIAHEPWHWRYVGVDHARRINELGITLEEYIEYLSR